LLLLLLLFSCEVTADAPREDNRHAGTHEQRSDTAQSHSKALGTGGAAKPLSMKELQNRLVAEHVK
jgi:hypothetical protein